MPPQPQHHTPSTHPYRTRSLSPTQADLQPLPHADALDRLQAQLSAGEPEGGHADHLEDGRRAACSDEGHRRYDKHGRHNQARANSNSFWQSWSIPCSSFCGVCRFESSLVPTSTTTDFATFPPKTMHEKKACGVCVWSTSWPHQSGWRRSSPPPGRSTALRNPPRKLPAFPQRQKH